MASAVGLTHYDLSVTGWWWYVMKMSVVKKKNLWHGVVLVPSPVWSCGNILVMCYSSCVTVWWCQHARMAQGHDDFAVFWLCELAMWSGGEMCVALPFSLEGLPSGLRPEILSIWPPETLPPCSGPFPAKPQRGLWTPNRAAHSLLGHKGPLWRLPGRPNHYDLSFVSPRQCASAGVQGEAKKRERGYVTLEIQGTQNCLQICPMKEKHNLGETVINGKGHAGLGLWAQSHRVLGSVGSYELWTNKNSWPGRRPALNRNYWE